VGRRIVVWAPQGEGESAGAAIAAAVSECDPVVSERLGEVVARALTEAADAVLLLAGPIGVHQERLDAITALRREGFVGPVLVGAAFLTEKEESLRAGADYAFDPDKQGVAGVIAAALETPTVCADHPFLRALLVGEWVRVERLGNEAPARPCDLVLTATSCHGEGSFWQGLAEYRASNQGGAVIVVEDEIDEDVLADALAVGATHWVELEETGLATLLELARSSVRERWLRRLATA